MKRKTRAGKLCQKEVATKQGLKKSERRRGVGGCATRNCERRRKTRLRGERPRIPIETETESSQASCAARPETVRMARIMARALWKSSCIEPEGVLNDQSPNCRNFSFGGRAFRASDLFTRFLSISEVPTGNHLACCRRTDACEAARGEGDPRATGGDSRAGAASSFHGLFAARGISERALGELF
jgi:hypothetical protein